MDISKIELIKKNLFDALENDTVGTPGFEEWHHKLFVEDEHGEIEEKYVDSLMYSMLRVSKNTNLNLDEKAINYFIFNDIAYHTSNESFLGKFFYNRLMRKAHIIKRVKPFKNKLGYEFVDYNGNKLEFSLLSKKCPHVYKAYPYLTDFEKRGGDCHPHSVCLSQMLSNKEVYVVTGNMPSIKAPNGFLHSWVELVADNGNTVVLDFNYNACFDKDDYYRLKKPTVLSKIPKEDIKKYFFDYEVAKHKKFGKIPLKETLLFFYELLEYYEKHFIKLSSEENIEPQPS